MLARTPNMMDEALACASRGWPVFPCSPKTKRPLVEGDKGEDGKPIPNTGGFRKATTDPAIIRDWWTRDPGALIGVPTGLGIGLWVLDFDPDGEMPEDIEARVEEAIGGPLPMGPRSRTQSGGWHIWFRMPVGELPKNSAKRLKGVDWRAEGGYVIVPPSRMSNGNAYQWLVSPDAADWPDAPAGLLDLVFKRGKFAPPPSPGRVQTEARGLVSDADIRRYCEVALQKAADRIRALRPGQLNVEINNIALGVGHLVGAGGISRQLAYDTLRQACHDLGLKDADKALKPAGTLDRALDDGIKQPQDLSHVTGRRQVARHEAPRSPIEDGEDYDRETGEVMAPPPPAFDGEPDAPPAEPDIEGLDTGRYPFKCLGFDRETYFYFSTQKLQITALKAPQHTPLAFLQLADLNYWSEFLGIHGKLSKEQWQMVANALMQTCHRQKIFSETRVRGRGAWIDGKTAIVHMGDEARINGQPTPLDNIPGKFIYEAAEPWSFEFGDPVSNDEARHLPEIAMRLTWQDRMSGALLAGWCVIAPVCGALAWRPHIWITGPSKAGKTTAVKEIVGRIVGPAAREYDGTTTEAAIRQTMGFDALPVILDEAESEDQAAVQRMQSILVLARVSSSGGTIAKGSQSGRAVRYVIRSCFLFSSINTALRHHADESRVTRLVLARNKEDGANEHYQALMRDINEHFTPEYAGGMFARTVANLPTLIHNIAVFKSAAAIIFNDRRAADQIGPMLAGYYLCFSDGRLTVEQAEKFLRKHDWTDHAALESETDEMRLLSYLMTRKVRVSYSGAAREMSIGQAIRASMESDQLGRSCDEALGPLGIRVNIDTVSISNTAEPIRNMLRDTQWASDWKRPLSMIDNAEKLERTIYFAPGLKTKAINLPLDLLME